MNSKLRIPLCWKGDELKRLEKALSECEAADPGMSVAVLAIRLLLFTGMRLGEVLNLTWEELSLDESLIRLSDAKAGARIVPLSKKLVQTLKGVERKGQFVIAGSTPNDPYPESTLRDGWKRILAQATLSDARLHDLRHTFGTIAGAQFNAFIVRDLLGHKTLAMTSRYVGRDTDPLMKATNEVSRQIGLAMYGTSKRRRGRR